MRRLLTLSVAAMTLGTLFPGAAHADLAKSGYIERYSSESNTGASVTESRRTYWRGDNLRVEYYTTRGQVVEIKSGATIYRYSPGANTAVKAVVPSGTKMPSVQDILRRQTTLPKGLKKVGKAKVAGVDCDVYTPAKKDSRVQTDKLYFSADSRLPVLMKRELVIGTRRVMEDVRKIQLNSNIPDSMFKVPSGVKIVEQKVHSAPPAPHKGRTNK